MEENLNHDDSSHYEISMTASQAFIAFVLLLFSLAAAFAFGVIVGRGQFEDSLNAAKAPSPISQQARVMELGSDDSKAGDDPAPVSTPIIIEEPQSDPARQAIAQPTMTPEPVPYFAQLLSTADGKAAEQLATRLIEAGFASAYVERSSSPRGLLHRVRVTFPSEQEARRAVGRLGNFASGEIWIARQ